MKPFLLIAVGMFCHIYSFAQLKLVKDINVGPYEASHPAVVGALSNGKVLFFATNTSLISYGSELWVSDGTDTGTTIVKDIKPGSNGSVFALSAVMMNDKLYFVANDGVHGKEMWVSDGTSTFMLKDIYPGKLGGVYNDGPFVAYNGKVYFTASDSVHGGELWCTDGTSTGTNMLIDLWPGISNSSPASITVSMSKLFFIADDGVHGNEYWCSDGTLSGTRLLHDIDLGAGGGGSNIPLGRLTFFNGNSYFTGSASRKQGMELYATDGTTAWLVKDIDTLSEKSSMPHSFTVVGNKLYFIAKHTHYGVELWCTDGTDTGTYMVKDIGQGNIGAAYFLYGDLNGKLLFSAETITTGIELWLSDGTATGTHILKDLFPGTSSGKLDVRSDVNSAGRYNECNNIHKNKYYFSGNDNTSDWVQLWQTDGTLAGTKKIVCTEPPPPLPGIHLSSIDWISVAHNKVWVSMMPGGEDYELYAYDIPADSGNNIAEINGHVRTSSVYPNPSNGSFILKLDNNGFLNGYMQVVDITGREVYSQSISSGERHLAITLEAPTGIYKAIVQLDGDIMTHTIQID